GRAAVAGLAAQTEAGDVSASGGAAAGSAVRHDPSRGSVVPVVIKAEPDLVEEGQLAIFIEHVSPLPCSCLAPILARAHEGGANIHGQHLVNRGLVTAFSKKAT